MSDPADLGAFLQTAWQHLQRGVADKRAPARTPSFATVSPEGKPEARTVVLRAASARAGTLELHTDVKTAKVASLRVTPFAALHIWVPRSQLQIRLSAEVDILVGDEVSEQWSKIPVASRVSYGTEPAPGTPIDDVYAYDKPAEQSRFAVLRCRVTEMDLVDLSSRHRRAVFQREDGWRGQWVAP